MSLAYPGHPEGWEKHKNALPGGREAGEMFKMTKTVQYLGQIVYEWPMKQEIQSFDMANVLLKLIGWFPAIPFVMTNEIESYKPASY